MLILFVVCLFPYKRRTDVLNGSVSLLSDCREILIDSVTSVILMPCLLVCFCVGPTGVGLNELKRKLLISDPQHFSVTIPRKFTPVISLRSGLCMCVCGQIQH